MTDIVAISVFVIHLIHAQRPDLVLRRLEVTAGLGVPLRADKDDAFSCLDLELLAVIARVNIDERVSPSIAVLEENVVETAPVDTLLDLAGLELGEDISIDVAALVGVEVAEKRPVVLAGLQAGQQALDTIVDSVAADPVGRQRTRGVVARLGGIGLYRADERGNVCLLYTSPSPRD